MADKLPITAERLREVLHYDPETGVFTWRVDRPRYKCLGKIAGKTTLNGYRSICFERKQYLVHRLAWLYVHGVWPIGDLDHIDSNRCNNKIFNLREATDSQNLANRGKQINNKSGFKGVSWSKQNKHWIAQITVRGNVLHIGQFSSPETAHAAYCVAAREHHGEFARTK